MSTAVAATAEHERLTVLCDDRDYQTVATVTGQPAMICSFHVDRCTSELSGQKTSAVRDVTPAPC